MPNSLNGHNVVIYNSHKGYVQAVCYTCPGLATAISSNEREIEAWKHGHTTAVYVEPA